MRLQAAVSREAEGDLFGEGSSGFIEIGARARSGRSGGVFHVELGKRNAVPRGTLTVMGVWVSRSAGSVGLGGEEWVPRAFHVEHPRVTGNSAGFPGRVPSTFHVPRGTYPHTYFSASRSTTATPPSFQGRSFRAATASAN